MKALGKLGVFSLGKKKQARVEAQHHSVPHHSSPVSKFNFERPITKHSVFCGDLLKFSRGKMRIDTYVHIMYFILNIFQFSRNRKKNFLPLSKSLFEIGKIW